MFLTFHRAKMNGSYGGSGIVDISERLRQGWLYANLYSASIGYFDGTEITYDQGNLGLYRSLPLYIVYDELTVGRLWQGRI
jgi:hypothetical protein